jgi:hypothetical protein
VQQENRTRGGGLGDIAVSRGQLGDFSTSRHLTNAVYVEFGLVSRVSPVQTALRNCTRDEGRPFEVGNHGSISSHCKPLRSKAMVVSVAVTSGQEVRAGKVGRGERKQTVDEVSKSD